MSNETVKGMDSRLAIVIPAYKSRFLQATLDSIAKQSCKDFVVYIGDDNSPQNLEEIVGRYRNEFPLVYHRFEENMGRNDLPGHWERCIGLSRNEPLIWLFSDDDLMPADGVERILQAAAVHGDTRVFSVSRCRWSMPKAICSVAIRRSMRTVFRVIISCWTSLAEKYLLRRVSMYSAAMCILRQAAL